MNYQVLFRAEAAVDSISRNPEAYPKIYKNIRRALIKRFPFGIYYIAEETQVTVLAILHAHRNPKEWKKRKS